MAYHPKEDELAAGQDECLVLWRKEMAGDWVPSIHGQHTSPIIGVGYCENGTRIYTGSQDGNIKLWENTKTQLVQSSKHTETITCYAVDSRASLLATGSRDMSVILWRLTTGDYVRTLLSHKREILSLEFSEDGVLLASGSSDDSAIVWDVASGNVLHVLGPHDGCGRVLAFSEDHRHLTTTTTQEINVWELKSGELMELRERDTQVNDAPKRPYSTFTFNETTGIVREMETPETPELEARAQALEAQRRARARALEAMLLEVAPGSPVYVYAQALVRTARFDDYRHCWEAEYLRCRLPPQHRVDTSLVLQDRVVLLCKDGSVLILDTSRVEAVSN